MTKRKRHREDLLRLLKAHPQAVDLGPLEAYIIAHSNLPGPRGNLELAAAFGDVAGELAPEAPDEIWAMCLRLSDVSSEEAPVNDPREMMPFCGAVGVGAVGSVCGTFFEPALVQLRALSNDSRWRMREGVVFGLQRLLEAHGPETTGRLWAWAASGSWLEMRAAAAGLAHPSILNDAEIALAALQLHREIMTQVFGSDERRAESFRVLRKGLAYTLSVVVRAVPDEGFPFLAELVETGDPDVLWIVRQNLKKKRLTKAFPQQVESVERLLAR